MATTNKNFYEEDDELAKLAQTNENMQKTKTMSASEITGVNNKISAYEKQYGGNLFDIDANSFTDATARQQFLTDRSDYGTLTSYRDTYNAQVESAKKAQAEKEAYANTRRTLMEKYIPETLNAMGLTGSGLAADTLLRMNNNYDNYILGAKSESQQAQGDAMQGYRDAWQTYTRQKDAEEYAKFETDNSNLGLLLTDVRNGLYDGDLNYALEAAKNAGLSDEMYQNRIKEAITYRDQEISKSFGITGEGIVLSGISDFKALSKQIGKQEGWKNTDNQIRSLKEVLEQSANWGADKNGTYIDFNDGKGELIYVFYNGKWYKTNKSKKALEMEGKKLYGVDDF